MSSSLYLPTSHLLNEARERFVEEQLEVAQFWNRELQRIDRHLDLVFITDKANEPGLVPGRWHVRRRNPSGFWVYMAITGPDGEYREMASDILERLKETDLWNPSVYRDRREMERRAGESKKRALALEREQLNDDAAAVYRAAKRVAGEGGMTKRRFLRG